MSWRKGAICSSSTSADYLIHHFVELFLADFLCRGVEPALLELLTNFPLDVANLEFLSRDLYDADAGTLLACSTGTSRAVGVVFGCQWAVRS